MFNNTGYSTVPCGSPFSQLWSPHLVKHIDQLENIQRSLTKHITGMQSLEYSERLVFLSFICFKEDVNVIVLFIL